MTIASNTENLKESKSQMIFQTYEHSTFVIEIGQPALAESPSIGKDKFRSHRNVFY